MISSKCLRHKLIIQGGVLRYDVRPHDGAKQQLLTATLRGSQEKEVHCRLEIPPLEHLSLKRHLHPNHPGMGGHVFPV